MLLFSISDLGGFISGVGRTVADTVTSIKLNTPYVGGVTPNQPQNPALASAGGLLSGGFATIAIIALLAWAIFKE